jgi:hypothetical protein
MFSSWLGGVHPNFTAAAKAPLAAGLLTAEDCAATVAEAEKPSILQSQQSR